MMDREKEGRRSGRKKQQKDKWKLVKSIGP